MNKHYRKNRRTTRKLRTQPLFEYSLPLSEEEWRHLLQWVERNYSRRVDQPSKEARA